MLERLIIAGLLIVVGSMGYLLYQRVHMMRLSQSAHIDPILSNVKTGISTIVYFTTPMCIPCKTQQQPTLSKLQTELGEDGVQIVQIDATQDPSAAERWGVMSAPTTFILDKSFQPKHINHGVADINKLKRQLGIIAA